MDWIAYCMTACGELDRAPNGSLMEAIAKVHSEKTGHKVMVGYEPLETTTEPEQVSRAKETLERISVPLTPTGYEGKTKVYFDKTGVALGTSEGAEAYYGDYYGSELFTLPSGFSVKGKTEDEITGGELEASHLFPKTYGDWVNLAESIKEKDPSANTRCDMNLYLMAISENDQYAEEAKRKMVLRAGELGIR